MWEVKRRTKNKIWKEEEEEIKKFENKIEKGEKEEEGNDRIS